VRTAESVSEGLQQVETSAPAFAVVRHAARRRQRPRRHRRRSSSAAPTPAPSS
jgi:hypothetical protein